MTLPCDRRSHDDLVADLNAQLGDDPRADALDLVVGILASVFFWSVVALVVTA